MHRRGDVHVPLCDRFLGFARRAAEQIGKCVVRHLESRRVVKVPHVESERPIGFEIDQFFQNDGLVARLPIGCEAHNLVLGRVDSEAEIVGEGAVQKSQRVWESDFTQHLYSTCLPDGERCGSPFPNAIDRKNGGFLVWRRKEGARGVTEMMLGKHQPVVPVHAGREMR